MVRQLGVFLCNVDLCRANKFDIITDFADGENGRCHASSEMWGLLQDECVIHYVRIAPPLSEMRSASTCTCAV